MVATGWDPGGVMDGLRGCVGVTIQVAQRNYNVLLKPDKQKRGAGTIRRERVDTRSSCRAENSSCTEPTRTFTIPSVA
jgi:hypothetical protein